MSHSFAYIHLRCQENGPCVSGQINYHIGQNNRSRNSDGLFLEWYYENNTLTVRNDGFGFYPCFVFTNHSEIIVSTSPLAIIAQGGDGRLDPEAFAVFAWLGFFIDNETPFAHIRHLPPGSTLVWHNGQTTLQSDGPYMPEPCERSPQEATDGLIELTRASVARCIQEIDDDIMLPLSGGRDSRHILFELIRQGVRPRACVTVGDDATGSDG